MIPLRHDRMERLLGEQIEPAQVEEILTRLGFELVPDEGWRVPPWRASDVEREVDLIEEVARVHGLDKLPTTLPARRAAVGRLTGAQRLRRRLEDALRDRGLSETVSYSFTSPRALAALRLDGTPPLRLENPLSEEQSLLRPLLLPGLLDAAAHNARPRARRGRPVRVGADVPARAAARRGSRGLARRGDARPRAPPPRLRCSRWAGPPAGAPRASPPTTTRHGRWWTRSSRRPACPGGPEPGELAFLHPGRQARSRAATARSWDSSASSTRRWPGAWELEGPVAVFELDLDALATWPARSATAIATSRAIPRCARTSPWWCRTRCPPAGWRRRCAPAAVTCSRTSRVFDLYRGEQVGEGHKSLALRLEFRAPDRTLTDEEVAERRAAIEREIETLGGSLRA